MLCHHDPPLVAYTSRRTHAAAAGLEIRPRPKSLAAQGWSSEGRDSCYSAPSRMPPWKLQTLTILPQLGEDLPRRRGRRHRTPGRQRPACWTTRCTGASHGVWQDGVSPGHTRGLCLRCCLLSLLCCAVFCLLSLVSSLSLIGQFKCGTGLSDRQRGHPPPVGTIVAYKFQVGRAPTLTNWRRNRMTARVLAVVC